MNWLQRLLQPQQGQNMLAQPQAQAAIPMMDNASMRVAQAHGSPNPNMPQMPGSMAAPQAEQAQQPGLMDRFKQFREGDRGQYLGDMFAGWAMGATPGQSLGMGAAMAREGRNQRKGTAQEQDRLNQTVEYLKGQGLDPDSAALVASNPQTLQEFLKQRLVPGQDKATDTMRNLEFRAAQAGIQPGTPEYQQFMLSGGGNDGVTVNNIMGEGDKFYENLDKKNADTFSALSETGVQSRAKLAQVDRLDTLLSSAPQGAAAMLKQAAGEYGINTEGLSEIQAAQALINELVPQQRQPGSGPMSDADLALFKQSLPRLINQPGGNKTIIDTMRAITQYQVQMGDIADLVADREISPSEGRKMIRELANPLDALRKAQPTGEAKQGRQPVIIDGYQIEVID
jgi:hypothetical protein